SNITSHCVRSLHRRSRFVASVIQAARTPCSAATNFFPSIRRTNAPLRDGCAALDRKRLTRHIARVVTQQEDCDVTDVVRLCIAPDRYARTRACDRFFRREHTRGHRSVDTTGTDAIRAYTARAVLHREQTRQRVDAALARGVARAVAVP